MSLPFPGQTSPFVGSGVPLKGVGPEHLRENSVRTEHILDGTIQLADLAAALQAFLVPTGAIIMWGNAAAPTGWFLCDGASKSRTTEAALFAVYGTTFGSVDGSSFSLPDLRQRFPLGKAASGTGATLGGTGGLIDHIHGLNTATSAALVRVGSNIVRALTKAVSSWAPTASTLGTATGNLNITDAAQLVGDSDVANPPFQVVNFICKR